MHCPKDQKRTQQKKDRITSYPTSLTGLRLEETAGGSGNLFRLRLKGVVVE